MIIAVMSWQIKQRHSTLEGKFTKVVKFSVNYIIILVSPSGDRMVLSYGVGVKVVNCKTGRVAGHLEEVRYGHNMIYCHY